MFDGKFIENVVKVAIDVVFLLIGFKDELFVCVC